MTVSSQIIEVLNDLCMKFGIAIDWSAENVLPYVQELIGKFVAWEIATSRIWIVVAFVMLFVGIALIATDVLCGWLGGFGIALGACLILASACVGVYQALDIATCTYFPEKQVFEYVVAYLETH